MNLPHHANGSNRFWEEDPWRVLRIMSEFVDSFEEMSQVPPGITIFGSARTPESNPYYQAATEMGRKLAKQGFAVITGGGPGIMDAANRGAAEVDRALSVGLNIELPHEQAPNPYAGGAGRFPLLLRPQGLPRQVQHGLRLLPRRIRNPRRIRRDRNPGSDRADSAFPDDSLRPRALGGVRALDRSHVARRRHDLAGRRKAPPGHRQCGRGGRTLHRFSP